MLWVLMQLDYKPIKSPIGEAILTCNNFYLLMVLVEQ